MALPEAKSPPEYSLRTEVLEACERGDNATLDLLLHEQNEKTLLDHGIRIGDMIHTAVMKKWVDTVRMLIARFPKFPTEEEIAKTSGNDPIQSIHNGLKYCTPGLPMHKLLIEKWPEMKKYNFGEMGDHLGHAAFFGDLELVKYLLRNGEKASEANFGTRPICSLLKGMERLRRERGVWMEIQIAFGLTRSGRSYRRHRQIYWLLRLHGATDGREFKQDGCACGRGHKR